MKEAADIVQHMMENDAFSQWLGIQVLEARPGYCHLKMTIREEMTNGFGIAHGGIAYSLADSALAFASNGHGQHALSIDTSIAHTQAAQAGQSLTATAQEKSLTRKTGLYDVTVKDQKGDPVAHFRGTVYRRQKEW